MKQFTLSLVALFIALSSFAVSPIAGPSVVCAGDTILLTDGTAGGTWTSSNIAVASIGFSTGRVMGLTGGTAVITYTMGASFAVYPITVNPSPVTFSVTGDGIICAGSTGTHVGIDSSSTGINYQMYFNGVTLVASLAGTGVAMDFGPQTGIGYYTVVGVNPVTGCANEMGGSVVTLGVTPVVIPSVTIGGGDTVCSGILVNFIATPVNGGSFPLFQWKVNGISVGTGGSSYSYMPIPGDVLSVVLTSNADCATTPTAADTATLTVVSSLIPTVIITASPGTMISAGTSVTFTASATSAGSAPGYQWTLNGVPVTGATASTYTNNTLTNGNVVACIVTSNGPCGGHTGNGNVSVAVTTTGVAPVTSAITDLKVQPNPGKGEFVITGTSMMASEKISVEITNMVGQVVYEKDDIISREGKIEVHISLHDKMLPGTYMLSLQSGIERKALNVIIVQ